MAMSALRAIPSIAHVSFRAKRFRICCLIDLASALLAMMFTSTPQEMSEFHHFDITVLSRSMKRRLPARGIPLIDINQGGDEFGPPML